MTPDPKFGYHWVWMVPVGYVFLVASYLLNKLTVFGYHVKMSYIRWRHPELKRLQEQAGIHKEPKV
jgi:hypothetical protein